MGKFWLRSESVSLSEPGEDFRWLWNNAPAPATAAFAFQALVHRGDVSRDDQWIDAPVRNPRSANHTNP